MTAFFENNIYLFWGTYAVLGGAWLLSTKLAARWRRALRVSIIYLGIPIIYLGHPFLYFQVWMFGVMYLFEFKLPWLGLFISVWVILLLFSTRKFCGNRRSDSAL